MRAVDIGTMKEIEKQSQWPGRHSDGMGQRMGQQHTRGDMQQWAPLARNAPVGALGVWQASQSGREQRPRFESGRLLQSFAGQLQEHLGLPSNTTAVTRSESDISSVSPKVIELFNPNVFISTYSAEKYKHWDVKCRAASTGTMLRGQLSPTSSLPERTPTFRPEAACGYLLPDLHREDWATYETF